MEKCALAEFTKGLTCVIYLQGCDINCSYCQNSDLIAPYSEKVMDATAEQIIEEVPWGEIDALSVTGGEPLWSVLCSESGCGELMKVLSHARMKRKATNIDTNGMFTNEDKLRVLTLLAPFLTSISVDIKHTSNTYLQQMYNALHRAELTSKARYRMVLYAGRWQRKTCIDSGLVMMKAIGVKVIHGTRNADVAPMMTDEECGAMRESYKKMGIDLVIR